MSLGRVAGQGPTSPLQAIPLATPVDRDIAGNVSTLYLATTMRMFAVVKVATSDLNLLQLGQLTFTRFRTFMVLTCSLWVRNDRTSRIIVLCPVGTPTVQLPQHSLVLGLVVRVHLKVRGTQLGFKTRQNTSR